MTLGGEGVPCGHGQLIVDLIADVSELRRVLARIEADRDAYRRVAVQAIHYAHELHSDIDRLTDQLQRQREENQRRRLADTRRAA